MKLLQIIQKHQVNITHLASLCKMNKQTLHQKLRGGKYRLTLEEEFALRKRLAEYAEQLKKDVDELTGK